MAMLKKLSIWVRQKHVKRAKVSTPVRNLSFLPIFAALFDKFRIQFFGMHWNGHMLSFVGELVKFKMCPKSEALHCLKARLLHFPEIFVGFTVRDFFQVHLFPLPSLLYVYVSWACMLMKVHLMLLRHVLVSLCVYKAPRERWFWNVLYYY